MRIGVCILGMVMAGAAWAQSGDGLTHAGDPGVSVIGSGGLTRPDLQPGYVIIEGDVQVTLAEFAALRSGADAPFSIDVLWPGGVVPYEFYTGGGGASVTQTEQIEARAAMDAVSAVTGVTFRQPLGTEDRIRIYSSQYNDSAVGHQGGTQFVHIHSWSNRFAIIHVLYHVLGFWHEQTRPNRDSYVTIQWANICGSASSESCTAGSGPLQCCKCADNAGNCIDCSFNFAIHSNAASYGSYDFDSLMHSGPTDFACNAFPPQPTITVNPPVQATIGQTDHLSYMDRIICRGVYPFASDRWWAPTAPGGGSGNILYPRNGSFASAAGSVPMNGTLFIRDPGSYAAIGTYSTPMYIEAPMGATLR